MCRGVICCDTTLIINFKQCKINRLILELCERYLKGCRLVVVGREIKDSVLREKIFEDLNRVFIVELLPPLNALRRLLSDEIKDLLLNFPELDEGELTLIAYARFLKKEGSKVCFLSDDKSARKAGQQLNLNPCCLNGISIGGTIGVINVLANGRNRLARKIAKKIRQKNNRIPINLVGEQPPPCKGRESHC